MSEVKTNKISPATGTAITLGDSGDTISIPSGATLESAGQPVTNAPAFNAYLSSHQALTDNTAAKVIFNAESFDTDSAYDTSTGKFTVPSGRAGKYFIYTACQLSSVAGGNDINSVDVILKKNGSYATATSHNPNGMGNVMVPSIHVVLDLSVGDYLEVFVTVDTSAGGAGRVGGNPYPQSYFGAYRLIGV